MVRSERKRTFSLLVFILFFLGFVFDCKTLAEEKSLSKLVSDSLVAEKCRTPIKSEPAPKSGKIRAFAFDIDDNILRLPTTVLVFHKSTSEVRELSTAQFAEARKDIGLRGEFQNFSIRPDRKTGSLKNFSDLATSTSNAFLNQLQSAVKDGHNCEWQGPAWKDFVQAMNSAHTARFTSLITARGHSPENIHQGFLFLKSQSLLQNVPDVSNIFPVMHSKLKTRFADLASEDVTAVDPSKRKAEIIVHLIDEIEKEKITQSDDSQCGINDEQTAGLHTWGFSDDDWGNVEKAKEVLSVEVAKKRWPHVRLSLFYTGPIKIHPRTELIEGPHTRASAAAPCKDPSVRH